MSERLIKIIEVWDDTGKFENEVQEFINRKDIETFDIQYSAVNDSEYSQVGLTVMIIYKQKTKE